MKIAIILAGHPRTFKQTGKSFWNAFRHLDPDIFIHTWEATGSTDQLWWTNGGERDIGRTNELEIENMYHPKTLEIQPEMGIHRGRKLYDNPDKQAAFHRMKSQWWSSLKAFQNIPDIYEYDIVIKTRFDLLYNNKLDMDLKDVQKKKCALFAPYPISIMRDVFSDTIVIADPEFMEWYLSYYLFIEDYMDRSVVKTGVPGWCSEYGATEYMRDNMFWERTYAYISLNAQILRESGDYINLY